MWSTSSAYFSADLLRFKEYWQLWVLMWFYLLTIINVGVCFFHYCEGLLLSHMNLCTHLSYFSCNHVFYLVLSHSRQASSGSAHMRPTSLRELPEPPISIHHSRNKSLSGVEALSTSTKGSSGAAAGASAAGSTDLSYHQHGHHARNCKSVPSVNVIASMDKDKPHSDGYDHLGPKRCSKPTGKFNFLISINNNILN